MLKVVFCRVLALQQGGILSEAASVLLDLVSTRPPHPSSEPPDRQAGSLAPRGHNK